MHGFLAGMSVVVYGVLTKQKFNFAGLGHHLKLPRNLNDPYFTTKKLFHEES